jgi:hypothetical protein
MSDTLTTEQITGTITAARDSVWVIEDTISKLAAGEAATKELKGNIERNVGHLQIVTSNPQIAGSGQNISDLLKAITDGQAKLAENIWPDLAG